MPPGAHRAASCAARSPSSASALSGSASTGHGPLSRLSSASPAGPRAPCSTPPSGRSGKWHSSQSGISAIAASIASPALRPCPDRRARRCNPTPRSRSAAICECRALPARKAAARPPAVPLAAPPLPSRSARAACRCRNASTTPSATPATGTASRPWRRIRYAPPQRRPFRHQVPHLLIRADARYPHGCCRHPHLTRLWRDPSLYRRNIRRVPPPFSGEEVNVRTRQPSRNPREPVAPDRRRRRTLARICPGLQRKDAQGRRRQGSRRVPRRPQIDDRRPQAAAGRARPARRRPAQFLEPSGREHARPRDGDDAENALLRGSTRSASISRSSIRPPGCACRASRTTRPVAP